MELAFIPSPSQGVVHLGPIPLRGYAFCIIIGVFVGVWIANKRWIDRGGRIGTVADIAVWAVPFGLVGGRLYHVITDYELYFTSGKDWVDAFKIWQGGLGIWGAIAFGALGAWIGCRRRGIALPVYADALAPGIAIAQAIGRWGNWFNQELYGNPTTLPWALKIDPAHRPVNTPDLATYQPTFLYESLWCVGVALLVIWADRRFRLGHGRAFAVYVAAYTVGRFWIEHMRVDYAHHILGMRLNDWTAIVVFIGAVTYFVLSARFRPGREVAVEPGTEPVPGDPAASSEPEGAAPVDLEKGAEPEQQAEASSEAGEPVAEDSADPAGFTASAGPAGPVGPAGPTGSAGPTASAAEVGGDVGGEQPSHPAGKHR